MGLGSSLKGFLRSSSGVCRPNPANVVSPNPQSSMPRTKSNHNPDEHHMDMPEAPTVRKVLKNPLRSPFVSRTGSSTRVPPSEKTGVPTGINLSHPTNEDPEINDGSNEQETIRYGIENMLGTSNAEEERVRLNIEEEILEEERIEEVLPGEEIVRVELNSEDEDNAEEALPHGHQHPQNEVKISNNNCNLENIRISHGRLGQTIEAQIGYLGTVATAYYTIQTTASQFLETAPSDGRNRYSRFRGERLALEVEFSRLWNENEALRPGSNAGQTITKEELTPLATPPVIRNLGMLVISAVGIWTVYINFCAYLARL